MVPLKYKTALVKQARSRYGDITPCKNSYSKAIFEFNDYYHFWFNISSKSTKAVKIRKGALSQCTIIKLPD